MEIILYSFLYDLPAPPVQAPYVDSSNPSGFMEGMIWMSVVSTSVLISSLLFEEYDSSRYFANLINNSLPTTSFPCMLPTYFIMGFNSDRGLFTSEEIWRTHKFLPCVLSSDNLYNFVTFGYLFVMFFNSLTSSLYVWYLVSVGSPKEYGLYFKN